MGMSSVATLYLPQALVEELKKRNLDLLDVVASFLKLDPRDVMTGRIELASKSLEEAKEFLEKGDPVQASEKLYKTVEECVKVLAQYLNLDEWRIAVEQGRWWTQLLGKAARNASRILGEPRIELTWSLAYEIHVWGFHEAKYTVEDIKGDVEHVSWLLEYARRLVLGKSDAPIS